ncbi:hypothetical protein BI364_15780 [Acidihalobacter yilgarnensis]|uniref:Leucine-binding protein domain-containing protein n=1 Tax=Acidihalobacter yilgarnensis TaxID=2819280 RepID=A0A1D8IRR4_9GAMM|nr:ABC transporter substrate-binding protein [Acidihalobacter yilgarnensis]AOU99200.1 hypothetical protein BI364_15780 [Acidihalobacter yilgarnensis]
MRYKPYLATALLAALPMVGHAASSDCSIPIGAVLPLTGSLSATGQENVKAVQLAVEEFNKAGGINGCTLKAMIYDSQTQPSTGVDAAKKLIDINHVPALVGAYSSGVSMAILTSATAPSKVVQISAGSTSPAFTQLAKEGKTGGYWFRTCPSDALQGVAMAYVAKEKAHLKKVAVIYLNNPYGLGLADRFKDAFTAYGGKVTSMVVYNPQQPSYRSEVAKALAGHPQALFLVAYPNEGATILREWISNGGAQKYLFPDALNAPQFITSVGAKYLDGHVWGTVPGSMDTPSLPIVKKAFKAAYGHDFTQPYDANAYDAVATIALAMEAGKCSTGTCIKDHIRSVTGDPKGTPVEAGVAGFKKARKLLAEGKTIRYVGASGDLNFDPQGDVQGPEVVWQVEGGNIVNKQTMSADEIAVITKKLGLK